MKLCTNPRTLVKTEFNSKTKPNEPDRFDEVRFCFRVEILRKLLFFLDLRYNIIAKDTFVKGDFYEQTEIRLWLGRKMDSCSDSHCGRNSHAFAWK